MSSRAVEWMLAPSTVSKNQLKAVEQTDRAPEFDNQPIPFSPVMIFTAQRNTNSSFPSAEATEMVAPRAQREPRKLKKRDHLKMKKVSEIGVVEKPKVPVEEKPETNGVESDMVEGEFVKAGFINNFSLTLILEEIEEDLFLMAGKKPPTNPNKKNPVKGDLYPENRLYEVCAAINELEGEATLQKN